ncbi:cyclopropane-fatty-acyl-phospholipid synthase family protein [Novosphingobium sp.]|uniref:cyclopropane-fatty-acyl-phospholipid synthase family protein n=1 Tax=Novosphingobium sp. TaxID=1874826 RepID=UPI003340CA95
MSSSSSASFPTAAKAARPWRAGAVLRGMRRFLAALHIGSISVVLPDGQTVHHAGTEPGPHGQITLHNWRALRRLLWRGDLGFAEGYIAGDWSSSDLVRLIAVGAANLDRLDNLIDGSVPVRLMRQLAHALRGNSLRGSRRNIAAHYDLGNAFYRPWLDDSMTYSSALALIPGQTLESAQALKLDRIAELLDLAPDHRVLEIGCGWGGLAARLARACTHVTGVTLSHEQLGYGQSHIAHAGLSNRVDLRLQDYRLVSESYDRIVSIEMLEAVGEAWWPTYFRQIHDRLNPGGRAVVQVITIAEHRFPHYRAAPDFIQHYIFPGGMLPTRTILAEQASAAGLVLSHQEQFGQGYAATLAEWRRRFEAAHDQISALGFDASFQRLWAYYLCYCEAAFSTGQIDVGLYVMEKPQ